MEKHNLNLTPQENQVLEALIRNLYAEAGFSDIDAHDLSRVTNIPTRSIRGTLSSLVKKGIVFIEATDSGEYQIVYLHDDYYYLHPRWKDEFPYSMWDSPEKKTYAQLQESKSSPR